MLKRLLEHGYFPDGLPPLFDTSSFADKALDIGNLNAVFTQNNPPVTLITPHSLVRSGGLRRRLSIVHPINFFRLARVFSDNLGELKSIWAKSRYSLTKPSVAKSNPRAFGPKKRQRAIENAKRRIGSKYVLSTDVSEFYPSVYTHTIPWAIHGKKAAKEAPNDFSLLGNRLDREIRHGQHKQTKGIPIGPDTSLAIAEIIMAKVDARVRDRFPKVRGVRYIDDMHFFTADQATAESLLSALENELGEYELQLNHRKTHITPLPQSLDHGFLSELRFRVPSSGTLSILEWTDYFDSAFALARQHPYDNVLRYAVSQVSHVAASPRTWETVQHLLWQTVALDPGTIRFVLPALLRNSSQRLSADKIVADQALTHLVTTSAPNGHGSEVAWALWAYSILKLKPNGAAWDAVLLVPDDIVAVSANSYNSTESWGLDAQSDTWAEWIRTKAFYEEHWLFSYEACRNGWCGNRARSDFFRSESGAVARDMIDQGVSFIDETAASSFLRSKANRGFDY